MIRAHGTRAKYVVEGCRCLPCCDANRDYARFRAEARRSPWRVVYAPASGTWAVVRKGGGSDPIRFGTDRQAAYTELRRRNAAEVRPDPVWADPDDEAEALERVRVLSAEGIGRRALAAAAGVSRSALRSFVTGSKRPKRRTVEAILGARPAPSAGSIVDAAETWRLIAEMLEAGATKGRIAMALGASRPALQIAEDRVLASTAAAVQELHDRFRIGSERMRGVCRCP